MTLYDPVLSSILGTCPVCLLGLDLITQILHISYIPSFTRMNNVNIALLYGTGQLSYTLPFKVFLQLTLAPWVDIFNITQTA